jgi:hypothetical protein
MTSFEVLGAAATAADGREAVEVEAAAPAPAPAPAPVRACLERGPGSASNEDFKGAEEEAPEAEVEEEEGVGTRTSFGLLVRVG